MALRQLGEGLVGALSLEEPLPFLAIPEEAEILPDPPWVRTRGSDWVSAFRVVKPGAYRKFGLVLHPQLHLKFKRQAGHKHAYEVPFQVITAFLYAGSKGKFVHRVLLGKGWNQFNKQCRYVNWSIIE